MQLELLQLLRLELSQVELSLESPLEKVLNFSGPCFLLPEVAKVYLDGIESGDEVVGQRPGDTEDGVHLEFQADNQNLGEYGLGGQLQDGDRDVVQF